MITRIGKIEIEPIMNGFLVTMETPPPAPIMKEKFHFRTKKELLDHLQDTLITGT